MHMPSNRRLKPHLKSHVGRTFSLRKVNLIPTYNDAKGGNAGLVNSVEELGQAVMVLDESNTRVCIVKATGGTVWIPKYYLLKEVKSELYKKYDALIEAVVNLTDISITLRNENKSTLASHVDNVINNLRMFADNEHNKVTGK
jgi:hypothetical protein